VNALDRQFAPAILLCQQSVLSWTLSLLDFGDSCRNQAWLLKTSFPPNSPASAVVGHSLNPGSYHGEHDVQQSESGHEHLKFRRTHFSLGTTSPVCSARHTKTCIIFGSMRLEVPLWEMVFRLGRTSQGPTRKSLFTTHSS